MPNADEEIDAQMAADSAEYDTAQSPPPPPEKKGVFSSIREKFSEMNEKAKADRERREEERKELKEAEKEASERGMKERKEDEKKQAAQKAYERERNRKPLLQTAMKFGGSAFSAGSRLAQGVSNLGGAGGQPARERTPIYGHAAGQAQQQAFNNPSFSMGADTSLLGVPQGGGIPLFAPPRPQPRRGVRMKKQKPTYIIPLISPRKKGSMGGMPPLFGNMRPKRGRRGFF